MEMFITGLLIIAKKSGDHSKVQLGNISVNQVAPHAFPPAPPSKVRWPGVHWGRPHVPGTVLQTLHLLSPLILATF